ncbi:hypothetical protein NDU88_008102 [Pleurodeles waltl]|uniref:Uncharacterized protein n=1 Tax=Pleurodeles waltl TaxID=8319 RepID=A0AAV7U370_PLEWA|nr:hypothetical protein NDU88_008102 [Pleurodeles waltl]
MRAPSCPADLESSEALRKRGAPVHQKGVLEACFCRVPQYLRFTAGGRGRGDNARHSRACMVLALQGSVVLKSRNNKWDRICTDSRLEETCPAPPAGTPNHDIYVKYGIGPIIWSDIWRKRTKGSSDLQWPIHGTFDKDKLDYLQERLFVTKSRPGMFDSLRTWQKEADQRRRKAEKELQRHKTRTVTEKVYDSDVAEHQQKILEHDQRLHLQTDKCYPSRTVVDKPQEEDPLLNDMLDKPPLYTPPIYPTLHPQPAPGDPIMPPPVGSQASAPPPTTTPPVTRRIEDTPRPTVPTPRLAPVWPTPDSCLDITHTPRPMTPRKRILRGHLFSNSQEEDVIEEMTRRWMTNWNDYGVRDIVHTMKQWDSLVQLHAATLMCNIIIQEYELSYD